jgi:hypothetical protein
VRREQDMDPRHRRRLRPELVQRMYADYLRLRSAEKVGKIYGRSRQSVFGIFQDRGLECFGKKFLPVVEYNGRRFTAQKVCGRHKYLRETTRGRGGRYKTVYLHHLIWEERYGAVPPGHKLVFKDGNHMNCEISNLLCLTNSDQVRRGATGANQFTKTAGERLGLLVRNFSTGRKTLAAGLK